MSVCAVCQLSDGLVINKIVAEPTDLAPDGCQLIPIDGVMCDIGWVWDGAVFTDPNAPTPVPPDNSSGYVSGD